MKRKVKTTVRGFRTRDGAGVNLVRVLGNQTTKEFDPFRCSVMVKLAIKR